MNTLKGKPKTNGTGIYMIYNADNHKVYIGATRNFHKRWIQHSGDLTKGRHHSIEMQKDFDKGDSMWFFVLERECDSVSNVELRNREWMHMLAFDDKRFLLYNKKESPNQIKRLLFFGIVMTEVRTIARCIETNVGISMYHLRFCKVETAENCLSKNQ